MIPGITLEPSARLASTLVTITGELDLFGYGFLRDGLLKIAADGPPGLIADIDGLHIGALSPATVFPLVARRIGNWPGIPFSVVTRQQTHLRTFHRYGADRFVAVHADVETAEQRQTIPVRRWAQREFARTDTATKLARAFLRDRTTNWDVPDLVYDGTLIVGELVGNALQHTTSAPDVRLDLRHGLLTIAVADDSPRPATLVERADLRDPGLGLRIVAQTAQTWAVTAAGRAARWSGRPSPPPAAPEPAYRRCATVRAGRQNGRVTLRDPDPEDVPPGLRDELAVSVRRLDGAQVVAADGTVDLHTVSQLADAVTAVLAQRPARLVIDLTEVDFLAAAGLHILLYAQHDGADSTQVRVVATGAALRSISLTEQDEVLAIYPNVADAINP